MPFLESCEKISELTLKTEQRCRDLHAQILPKLGEQCDLAVPLVRDCMKGVDEAKKFGKEIKPITTQAKDYAEQFMRASEDCLSQSQELVETVKKTMAEVKGTACGVCGVCFGCASDAAGQVAPNRVDTSEDREEVDSLKEKVEKGDLDEMKNEGADALELVGGPRRENLRIGYMTMMSITEIIRKAMQAITEKQCLTGLKMWKRFSRLEKLADCLLWFAEELLRLAKCIYAFLEVFWKKVSNLEKLVIDTILNAVKEVLDDVGDKVEEVVGKDVVDVVEDVADDVKDAAAGALNAVKGWF